jgi:hypothetical protein
MGDKICFVKPHTDLICNTIVRFLILIINHKIKKNIINRSFTQITLSLF